MSVLVTHGPVDKRPLYRIQCDHCSATAGYADNVFNARRNAWRASFVTTPPQAVGENEVWSCWYCAEERRNNDA